MKKTIALLLALLVVTFAFVSCQKEPPKYEDLDLSEASIEDFEETTKRTDYVLITVKDYGEILVRLFPDVAPETVDNFKELVADEFYDGLIFHTATDFTKARRITFLPPSSKPSLKRSDSK